MAFERLVRELKSLVRRALAKREAERALEEALFEDVTIESDEDWRALWHDEVPSTLKDVLERAGLSCRIFHKKDEVPGPEYVANCIARGGRKVALGLDVDYDHEVGEVRLTYVKAYGDAEWTPSQLVYYHET